LVLVGNPLLLLMVEQLTSPLAARGS
jgi:hypothetical protein